VEEQKLAKCYPAHTALCIRDGWDFCGPEKAAGDYEVLCDSCWG